MILFVAIQSSGSAVRLTELSGASGLWVGVTVDDCSATSAYVAR